MHEGCSAGVAFMFLARFRRMSLSHFCHIFVTRFFADVWSG